MVVVPASLQLLLLHCFPESPRYLLIERNNVYGATKGAGISWGRLALEDAGCFSKVFQDQGASSWHSHIPRQPTTVLMVQPFCPTWLCHSISMVPSTVM